ncbi:DUF2336 domain-containing protein [Bradyrhizobium sp.]|uniref:DUF2336 domain-containing protein n=1 Tax=Bradyrhizobium sp. TaxID=376 RepID=UPI0025C11F89|nr:DUF2336 domain-containing protein [Bradyrhizobium sp.]
MQQPAHSIISELEDAVSGGSSAKRISTLRRVTDLFLHDGERLNDEQVRVFDDVLCFLIARVETRARAELARRLAPVDYAPFEVIQHLAFDDEIEVAGDVLTNSSRLGTEALVRIASTKGQDHLLAISARANLPEAVTDVIVDRGEDKVIRRLANNASARFSETGYSGMVAHAEGDDELIQVLGLRVDLPVKFLRDLLRRAKDAVRDRLMAIAPASVAEEIRRVLDTIAKEEPEPARDFSVAEQLVKLMKELGELDEAAIVKFVGSGKFDEVAAALAALNDVPTALMARVMEGTRADLLLIPCKSAGLDWMVVESILRHRPAVTKIDDRTIWQAHRDYGRLSAETAQRTVRFWQLHNRIEKPGTTAA